MIAASVNNCSRSGGREFGVLEFEFGVEMKGEMVFRRKVGVEVLGVEAAEEEAGLGTLEEALGVELCGENTVLGEKENVVNISGVLGELLLLVSSGVRMFLGVL